jgi:malonyl-CoA/methylmalonyl-CoA synthetase
VSLRIYKCQISADDSSYLNNKEATSASFDSDGFYKTGDMARRVGDDFIFEGRISTDCKHPTTNYCVALTDTVTVVRSQGFKIPIMKIETQLLKLPFVSECCVVALPDNTYGQRVAALIRLESSRPQTCTERDMMKPVDGCCLRSLRASLADFLPLYMLPTALRILKDSEEIPRTSSLKVSRRKALEKYFDYSPSLALPPEVELWDEDESRESWPRKAWDWAGLPRGEMQ